MHQRLSRKAEALGIPVTILVLVGYCRHIYEAGFDASQTGHAGPQGKLDTIHNFDNVFLMLNATSRPSLCAKEASNIPDYFPFCPSSASHTIAVDSSEPHCAYSISPRLSTKDPIILLL
jgi:hypothetical protein